MANLPYQNALDLPLAGGIDWAGGDFMVVACSIAYTFNVLDESRDDLVGVIATASIPATFLSGAGNVADGDDVLTMVIPTGQLMERLILCLDTGTPADDLLLAHWDHNENGTPIYRPGDDTVAPVLWSAAVDKILAFHP